jgi:hypothetical protein
VSAILLGFGGFVVPTVAQPDIAVNGAIFERFDGLDVPDTNPASKSGEVLPSGSDEYGFDQLGHYPAPGKGDTRYVNQTYTRGPLKGLTNTLGGQPLPVNDWKFRGDRQYTKSKTHSIQHRMGDGQAYQGAAQTVQLSEITGNPPVPGDLSGIIAGYG